MNGTKATVQTSRGFIKSFMEAKPLLLTVGILILLFISPCLRIHLQCIEACLT